MLSCRFLQAAVLVGLLLALALTVRAQDETTTGLGNAVCPDTELLGPKLITDICWCCLSPLRIAGAPIGGGSVPSGASDQALCACTDPAGLPSPGVVIGMWEPARIVDKTIEGSPCAGERAVERRFSATMTDDLFILRVRDDRDPTENQQQKIR
ncbi:TraU family protein [Thiorhodococcus minor]|uniref:TraU family protein n=1 Tax=Thiorhodococcus minor TaxID=57489 RepID=UPI001FD8624F|nr:TraU family protein [Thiorhodococcus minor]